MFTRNAQINLPCDVITIHQGMPPYDINDPVITDHMWVTAVDGRDVTDERTEVIFQWRKPPGHFFWAAWFNQALMYVGYEPVLATVGATITIHLPIVASAY